MTVPGTALGNAAPDDLPVFVAAVEGHETQDFDTLQGAMIWLEDFEKPTATISFLGEPIVRYVNGDISAH